MKTNSLQRYLHFILPILALLLSISETKKILNEKNECLKSGFFARIPSSLVWQLWHTVQPPSLKKNCATFLSKSLYLLMFLEDLLL
jgi:hypothetical protein